MYKYSTYVDVEDLGGEDVWLGLSLKSGIAFKFQECYCSFKRKVDGPDIFERLTIRYYSDNLEEVKKVEVKIKRCLDLLSFIFFIPMPVGYVSRTKCEVEEELDKMCTNKKIEKLNEIDNIVNGFRKTKDRFFDVLEIFRKGMRYHFMLDFQEEAYLYYFKAIENVVKDYFDKEGKDKLDVDNSKVKKFLEDIYAKELNVVYSENKLENLIGNLKKMLIKSCSEDVYSKISFFAIKIRLRLIIMC
ncbi:hypothetical protein SAMN02745196_02444 [Clostridium collagenovorans DSM 3089]|uniref:Uncharacterized protein n=1 Tax=Clostridium collagenovorans DSM 3089 TaxID=1121306 RepID=A0A1M5XTE4_9CLOT|nr:hypothetical protein [Clostridium collagenovorans]SHI02788.1 hypothetical protein SAMN02745196_02444 [Clostridium collagenovorans DSM 3089]